MVRLVTLFALTLLAPFILVASVVSASEVPPQSECADLLMPAGSPKGSPIRFRNLAEKISQIKNSYGVRPLSGEIDPKTAALILKEVDSLQVFGEFIETLVWLRETLQQISSGMTIYSNYSLSNGVARTKVFSPTPEQSKLAARMLFDIQSIETTGQLSFGRYREMMQNYTYIIDGQKGLDRVLQAEYRGLHEAGVFPYYTHHNPQIDQFNDILQTDLVLLGVITPKGAKLDGGWSTSVSAFMSHDWRHFYSNFGFVIGHEIGKPLVLEYRRRKAQIRNTIHSYFKDRSQLDRGVLEVTWFFLDHEDTFSRLLQDVILWGRLPTPLAVDVVVESSAAMAKYSKNLVHGMKEVTPEHFRPIVQELFEVIYEVIGKQGPIPGLIEAEARYIARIKQLSDPGDAATRRFTRDLTIFLRTKSPEYYQWLTQEINAALAAQDILKFQNLAQVSQINWIDERPVIKLSLEKTKKFLVDLTRSAIQSTETNPPLITHMKYLVQSFMSFFTPEENAILFEHVTSEVDHIPPVILGYLYDRMVGYAKSPQVNNASYRFQFNMRE